MNRATSCPERGAPDTIAVLMNPKPAVVWPAAFLVCVAKALVDVGLLGSVRLKTLLNSART